MVVSDLVHAYGPRRKAIGGVEDMEKSLTPAHPTKSE